jgi:hypothetical protein
MKHLFDMNGRRYEVPDEVAASSVQPIAGSLLFDNEGKLYQAAPHDLSKYQVAGSGGRLAVLNPAASTTGEEFKGKQRLCGPIVTWCDRGFCLT